MNSLILYIYYKYLDKLTFDKMKSELDSSLKNFEYSKMQRIMEVKASGFNNKTLFVIKLLKISSIWGKLYIQSSADSNCFNSLYIIL